MTQPAAPVEVEMPSTIEIDRKRLAVLEGQRNELKATQTVLACISERLAAALNAETVTVSNEEFENAPDLRAERRDGIVTITTSR